MQIGKYRVELAFRIDSIKLLPEYRTWDGSEWVQEDDKDFSRGFELEFLGFDLEVSKLFSNPNFKTKEEREAIKAAAVTAAKLAKPKKGK